MTTHTWCPRFRALASTAVDRQEGGGGIVGAPAHRSLTAPAGVVGSAWPNDRCRATGYGMTGRRLHHFTPRAIPSTSLPHCEHEFRIVDVASQEEVPRAPGEYCGRSQVMSCITTS